MAVKIPIAHREPLRKLAIMSAQSRSELVAAIQDARAVLQPDELIEQVSKAAKLDESVVSPIIWMLISMYRVADGKAHQFAIDTVNAAKETLELRTESQPWDTLAYDLETILSANEPLGVTAKVLSVRTEYENVFCTARILTDIRPVFGPDTAQAPLAAAIVHTLHIEHHTGNSHKDFYVAMDDVDLRKLQVLIDRAVKNKL